jgi:hypothetical protein
VGVLKSKKELAILASLFVLSFIPVVGGTFRVFEIVGGPVGLPDNPRISNDPLPALLHVFGAVPFCILGAFQFLPSIRQHTPERHRFNGRIVALTGILSAVSGLWMTHYYALPIELQGSLLYTVRMVLGIAMVVFIVLGVVAIKTRHIPMHGASMLRAYAIGQGAGTQALIGITWIVFFGEEAIGLTRDVMMTLAWVINLGVAEWVIRKTSW